MIDVRLGLKSSRLASREWTEPQEFGLIDAGSCMCVIADQDRHIDAL